MSAPVPPPLREARREALAARQLLEGMLLTLAELPRSVDRAPLGAAIEGLRARLAQWSETDVDHPELHGRLEAALEALAGAAARLGAVEGWAAARGAATLATIERALQRCKALAVEAIVASPDRLLRAPPPAAAAPARPFRASVGVPSLQRLPRGLVAPVIAVAAPEEEDVDPGELDLESEEDEDDEDDGSVAARVLDLGPEPSGDPGELEQLRQLARDCIEDLGNFDTLRQRNPDEVWTAVLPFEQRLLNNVDALLALEVVEPGAERIPGVVTQALREAADETFPDPRRAFAATFALGCLDGEDVVDAMLIALRQADPDTWAAHRSALVLAPSPGIAPGLRRLLGQRDPRLLCLALGVLRERREASFGDAALLLGHGDPSIAEAAARVLGVVPERAAAVAALEDALLGGPDDVVVASIAESLLLLGSRRGLTIARTALEEELALPEAAESLALPRLRRLIGLSGDLDDAPLLVRAFTHAPHDPAPLGWLGHVSAVAPLAAAAAEEAGREAEVSARSSALVEGLHRITGAPMLRPPVLGSPAAPFDAGAFDAWWREHEGRFSPRVRHRFGRPYAIGHSVDELERDEASPEAREIAALEIAIAGIGASLFRTGDWVARQQAEIAALRRRLPAPAAP